MKSKLSQICLALSTVCEFDSMPVRADYHDDLVNALIVKGVLTEEEGALLMNSRRDVLEAQKKKEEKHWTNHVNIRGYVQTRSNKIIDGGGDYAHPVDLWMDRSVGDKNSIGQDKSFLIRRARMIIFGDTGEHLSYYLQADFASSATGANNVAQLRDAYGDVNLDHSKVHRFRVGQSKVPFGFENMQSSQNRLSPDRTDAINTGARDERDTGVFYYYTPLHVQTLFKEIQDKGLKHSGNYGMFGAGLYNGQGSNRADQNDNLHTVARVTYPWKTESGQIYEASIQGYYGSYTPELRTYKNASLVSVTPKLEGGSRGKYRNGFDDQRVGLTFVMYPQPFGLQAEWNWGKTPGLDATTNTMQQKSLQGGYVQAMYKLDNWHHWGTFIPYIKWQTFDGYNKMDPNAPKNDVNDTELGVEWQIGPELELTAEYHHMHRNNIVTGNRTGTVDYQRFKAQAIRMQLQYNF